VTIPFKTSEHQPSRREWATYYRRRASSYAAGIWPGSRASGRLAIVCEPRTGSELLCRTLSESYAVRYDGEIFTTPALHPGLYCRGRANLAALRGEGYACKLITRQLREGMHYLSWSAVLRGLHSSGFRFVRLERRDKIAEAVSALRSMTVETWHQRSGSPPPDRVDVEVDHLITVLALNALSAAWWRWASEGVPVHRIWYEDDLSSPERLARTVEVIADLAGLSARPGAGIEPALVRTSVGGWRDVVTNVAEVEAAVGRSSFRHLLEEG
jgi:hypothetical protein